MKVLALPFLFASLLLSGCYNTSSDTYHLGNIAFNEGRYKDSFQYYLYAAKQNITPAQYAVGYQYYYGLGVESNIFKSVYWFKEASFSSERAVWALHKINTHQEPAPWTIGLKWKK